MKKLIFLKFILLGFLVSSCSKSEESGGGGGGENPDNKVTSITLATAVADVNTGSQVVFSVKGNSNEDFESID